MRYRPDIDGLRALAIIGVLVYHLCPDLLVGGFTGVDVFFVISGYLITRILLSQLETGSLRLTTFWVRRFKRLYPALVFMTAVTLAFGALILPEPEHGELGSQVIAALMSFSNLLLLSTKGGYWGAASENVSLLHTWSLSIEEQFYLTLPGILWVVKTYWKERYTSAIAIILFASFTSCVIITSISQNAAFYLLPTRMWELLLGCLLASFKKLPAEPRSAWVVNAIQVIGVGLIVISYFMVSVDEGFPGFKAIIPCAGALILIWLGGSRGIVNTILSFRLLVYIGKISYSLYLWHWPILVYSKYINPSQNVGILIAMIAGLSILSYYLIERPFRVAISSARAVALSVLASASVAGAIMISHLKSPLYGEAGDFNAESTLTRGVQYEATERILGDQNVAKNENAPLVVVVGSSHARVLCAPIEAWSHEYGFQFLSLATSGVGLSEYKPSRTRSSASEINDRRMRVIEKLRPEYVIIAGMWSSEMVSPDNLRMFEERLAEISAIAKTVIVCGQVPMVDLPTGYKGALRKYVAALFLSGKNLELKASTEVDVLNQVVYRIVDKANLKNVIFVDPSMALKNADGSVKIWKSGVFLYYDHHHLNDKGADYLWSEVLRNTLEDDASIIRSN